MATNGKSDPSPPRGIGVRTRRMSSTFVWSNLAWLVSVSDDQLTGLIVTHDPYCICYLGGAALFTVTTEDCVVFPELPACRFQARIVRRGCNRCQRDLGCNCPWRDTLVMTITGDKKLPPPMRLQIRSPMTCCVYLDRKYGTVRCVEVADADGAMTEDGVLDQHAWRGRIGCCPGPDGAISIVEMEGKGGSRVSGAELAAYYNSIG